MKRLRCCGRFCFYKLPIGPWKCTVCERTQDGPMPKSAERRFWQHIDETVTRLDAKPEMDLGEVRRIVENTVEVGYYLKREFPA